MEARESAAGSCAPMRTGRGSASVQGAQFALRLFIGHRLYPGPARTWAGGWSPRHNGAEVSPSARAFGAFAVAGLLSAQQLGELFIQVRPARGHGMPQPAGARTFPKRRMMVVPWAR